jgi:hypothetical protein
MRTVAILGTARRNRFVDALLEPDGGAEDDCMRVT